MRRPGTDQGHLEGQVFDDQGHGTGCLKQEHLSLVIKDKPQTERETKKQPSIEAGTAPFWGAVPASRYAGGIEETRAYLDAVDRAVTRGTQRLVIEETNREDWRP